MTRKLDRRQALAAFGSVSLGAVLAACSDDDGGAKTTVTTEGGGAATVDAKTASSPTDLFERATTCRVTPQATEGPYYFDVDSIRSDIREDRKGTLLRLGIRVRDAGSCKPIENAVVDIWHCDAEGSYSGFEAASPGGGRSDRETYLRGAQVTNSDGIVQFRTVYPGWYPGRTPHIHAKVHLDRRTVLTSQLYFDDDFTARVYEAAPYASRSGRDSTNDSDAIFDESLVLTLARDGKAVLGALSFDVERG